MTPQDVLALTELIRGVNDNISALSKNVAENQNYLFALHDCVQTLPGYSAILFGNKIKEYQENSSERIQKDLKAAQDALADMLRRFSGPVQ